MRLGFRWWHSLALCLFERAVFANPWKMDYANLLPPMPTKTSRARRRSSAAEFYVDPEALAASVAASEAANHAPASSILGAISRNPDPNIVAQLCGFDPLDLLNTVDFPNDRYERLLKISREARQLAMRREDIPLSNGDVEEVGAFIGSSRPGTSGKLLEQVLEPTTKFSLDAKEGIRVEEISAEAANEAISEAKQKEIEVLKEQLARSAASITIQALFRGYLIRRKYVSVKFHKMTIDSVDTESYPKLVSGLPGVLNLTIQERLIKKYETFGRIYESIYSFLPDFPYFCAAKIQAVFRMYIFRRKWLYFQAMSWEEKDGLIGREAKNAIIRRAERATYKVNTYVRAVIRIQKAWKSYSSKKVYKFYRNMIHFRESGNPSNLLKYVNPQESKLIDAASSTHVRFRLGGTSFPPTIYYKIFVHSKLVDMNSFAPRDYTKVKQKLPIHLFTKGFEGKQEPDNGGWYQRFENNGWRPIVHRNWMEEINDEVVTRTASKVIPFHHMKLKRRQEVERLKKIKKLEWMKKLYKEGRKMQQPVPDPFMDGPVKETGSNQEFNVQSEEGLLNALMNLESEVEHDFLTRWSEALDYDAYCDNWLELSTTGKSEDLKSFKKGLENVNLQGLMMKVNDIKRVDEAIAKAASDDINTNPMMGKDTMLAEIDLFRKIAAGSAVDENSALGSVEGAKKPRPWSGRSNSSLEGMFLTDHKDEF